MELFMSGPAGTKGSVWLTAHAIILFAFLYLPIAILITYSFNGQGVGGFPPRDLTLNWYRILFQDGPIWDSVLNSLIVAAAAMFISALSGILLVAELFGGQKVEPLDEERLVRELTELFLHGVSER